jgi:hypothetical protein
MLATLIATGLLAAGGPAERDATPYAVQRPVRRIAETTVRINGLPGYRLLPCDPVGPRAWVCPVDYGVAAASYTVGPELRRKRRGGRWVGPWRPTSRLAVTGVL